MTSNDTPTPDPTPESAPTFTGEDWFAMRDHLERTIYELINGSGSLDRGAHLAAEGLLRRNLIDTSTLALAAEESSGPRFGIVVRVPVPGEIDEDERCQDQLCSFEPEHPHGNLCTHLCSCGEGH